MDFPFNEHTVESRYHGPASNGNASITGAILKSLETFFFILYIGKNRYPPITDNKFVRTKMRLKLGTKIDLSERFVRFVRFAGLLDLSDIRFVNFRDPKKNGRPMDQRTDGRTDRPTDRPSYRDAWTHLKSLTNVLLCLDIGHSWINVHWDYKKAVRSDE